MMQQCLYYNSFELQPNITVTYNRKKQKWINNANQPPLAVSEKLLECVCVRMCVRKILRSFILYMITALSKFLLSLNSFKIRGKQVHLRIPKQ
jgi:hypothetical protein